MEIDSKKHLSAGEFATWKDSPTTKKVFDILEKVSGDFVFDLVNGSSLRGGNTTIEATAKLVGIIYGLDLFLKMKVRDKTHTKS